MKVVYVAGPIRNQSHFKRHRNILRGEEVAYELWEMGYAAICPHKNTEFLDGILQDYQILQGDMELIKRSDAIVVCQYWRHSAGTMEEIHFCKESKIPVFFWEYDQHCVRNWAKDDYDIEKHVVSQVERIERLLTAEIIML